MGPPRSPLRRNASRRSWAGSRIGHLNPSAQERAVEVRRVHEHRGHDPDRVLAVHVERDEPVVADAEDDALAPDPDLALRAGAVPPLAAEQLDAALLARRERRRLRATEHRALP